MDRPLSAVARVATTPEQAKIFVALLQAEGIPAYVEGDSLADEFATSRRMMNLVGTKVMVPTTSLDRARELLVKVEIDPAELEQQALAAADGESVPVPSPRPTPPARTTNHWPLVVAIVAAIVFLGLWLAALDANVDLPKDRRFVYEQTASGMREIRRRDGRLMRTLEALDKNGVFCQIHTHASDGTIRATQTDADGDGVFERYVEHREGGLTTTWIDKDGDDVADEGRTTDAQGHLLQTIVWQPNVGYVVQKP